jgi:hypothetical protein
MALLSLLLVTSTCWNQVDVSTKQIVDAYSLSQVCITCIAQKTQRNDDVAEWLRREIANLVYFVREGSNPFVVDVTFEPHNCARHDVFRKIDS